MVLTAMNRILHERNLEEYYCTLCYGMFDFKRKTVTFANSGLPFPIRCTGGRAAQVAMPGTPLGSFGTSTYDEVVLELNTGDAFVFCTDGIFEATDHAGREFGADRIVRVVEESWRKPARDIVQALLADVDRFVDGAEQHDDRTVVVLRVT